MLGQKLRRLGILAAPPAALTLMATSAAMAQYPYRTSTFDTSSSISTVASYNPPPIITRFDYGTVASDSTGWSNAADHTGNGGGSLMQSATFKPIVTGVAAFTVDITNNLAVPTSMLSFYIMIAPGSAYSTTVGGPGASSGYFQPVIRDSSYDFTNVPDVIVNGIDQGANGWNFGDPTYSGTSDQGTWEFIQIPLDPTMSTENIRALTFQDYDDNTAGGRKITGTVTWYIDDLTITPVPEPATLGLLGLAVPTLLARRRKHA
jgi:PEP-CTERM motif